MPTTKNNKKSNIYEETRLSMSTENYLLSIFRLQEQQPRLSLTQLADHLKTLPEAEGLGTSLPSVSAMIRRMVREGLVESDQKKGIILTNSGSQSGANIVRRHRLAERMVVDLLGIDLANAHIEAHQLEHAISPELEANIVSKLGDPKTCPFGHPIPGSGYTPSKDSIPLDN
ncbi:MAG: metal-dependent transcriptional regulator, partial [Anaerolineales bacterium]|nr:metal-dependent transcriptional regulator [Anaerolineales bacterium]